MNYKLIVLFLNFSCLISMASDNLGHLSLKKDADSSQEVKKDVNPNCVWTQSYVEGYARYCAWQLEQIERLPLQDQCAALQRLFKA